MTFVCTMTYTADRALIDAVRPAHRAYMFGLIDQGRALLAGSFPDGGGGLFMYAVEHRDEAEKLVRADPYVTDGVAVSYVLQRYEIHGASSDRIPAPERSTGTAPLQPPG